MKNNKYNNLPQTIFDLGEIPDGEYIGTIVGMRNKSQSNSSLICSFNIEISLEDNGYDVTGKVKKSKGFYEKGKTYLVSFLEPFGVIAENGTIDWDYFGNQIPVYVTLETNDEGWQCVKDVIPQYEDYEEEVYENE